MIFKKMIHMFTGDLYSMYVVLQGIGCLTLSYMYKGIYHIRNFVWGVATLDVWSSSTRTFQPKKRKWSISFYIVFKKMSFSGSPKGTPHDWCRRTMKKRTILQWKLMELGGDLQKDDTYVHWGPIFYVCSSARNWVSYIVLHV